MPNTPQNDPKDDALIDDFLANRILPEQLPAILQRQQTDQAFAQEIEFRKMINAQLRLHRRTQVQAKLQKWVTEMPFEEEPIPLKKPVVVSFWPRFSWIAAAVIVGVGLWWLWPSPERTIQISSYLYSNDNNVEQKGAPLLVIFKEKSNQSNEIQYEFDTKMLIIYELDFYKNIPPQQWKLRQFPQEYLLQIGDKFFWLKQGKGTLVETHAPLATI